jgi:2-polyprenyl-3-methyl-5-hydroxy-6-metoxy-1,4-benzoquinol methylase
LNRVNGGITLNNVMIDYYLKSDEKGRLIGRYSLERIRSQEIILRYLPKSRIKILDIGGANGIYSFWLASEGHDVDLIDLVPRHIDQAKENEKTTGIKLTSIKIGNACALPYRNNIYDIVLFLGPLYHLLEKEKRIQSLLEAKRVLKSNGIVFAAVISRYASMIDGFLNNFIEDNEFRKMVIDDLNNGNHINRTGKEKYFTTAYFHYPEELKTEIEEAGLVFEKMLAVEGFGCCITNIENKMKDEQYQKFLLECLRKTEEESSIIGMSFHYLGIGRKK